MFFLKKVFFSFFFLSFSFFFFFFFFLDGKSVMSALCSYYYMCMFV